MTPVAHIHGQRFQLSLHQLQGIQVTLGKERHRAEGRILQKQLQAMGCKVTNRMTLAAA